MRKLRSRALPPVGNWVVNPHPAPKADLFLNSHYTRYKLSINERTFSFDLTSVTSISGGLNFLLFDIQLFHDAS